MLRFLPLFFLFTAPLFAQSYLDSLDYGGVGPDGGYGVAFDNQGNSYLCGKLDGTVDLQPGSGTHSVTAFYGAYVVKYDANRDVVWSALFEPVNPGDFAIAENVAVDSNGNVYVTGRFTGSVDLNPGTGSVHDSLDTTGAPSGRNAFLVKFDAGGNHLWDHVWHGTTTWGARLSVTDTRVCLSGLYGGTMDLDPGSGTEFTTTAGGSTFLVTLDDSGNYLWGTGFSTSLLDLTLGISLGANDVLTVATCFAVDITLGHTAGAPYRITTGNADTLLIQFDAQGNMQWLREISGLGSNVSAASLARDPNGDVYVSGSFRGGPDFDPGAGDATLYPQGGLDGYVVKFTASGDFEWVKALRSNSDVEAFNVVADRYGVAVSGEIYGLTDLNPGANAAFHDIADGAAFAVRLDIFGDYVWSANWGGSGTGTNPVTGGPSTTTEVFGMASDDAGTLLMTGPFQNVIDLDPGSGTVNSSYGGDTDAWALWLDDAAATLPAPMRIDDATLPLLAEGLSASVTFTAQGGSGSGFTWSLAAGQLPPGLSGVPGNGTPSVVVSGTATTPGTYNFRLRVDDDNGSFAERNFRWTVATPGGQVDPDPPGGGGGACTATIDANLLWLVLLLTSGLGAFRAIRARTNPGQNDQ